MIDMIDIDIDMIISDMVLFQMLHFGTFFTADSLTLTFQKTYPR